MSEIILKVNDKNTETVLLILKNLKVDLIDSITVDAKLKKTSSQYQGKTKTIIREENSGTADKSGKYLSATAYKQKLKK